MSTANFPIVNTSKYYCLVNDCLLDVYGCRPYLALVKERIERAKLRGYVYHAYIDEKDNSLKVEVENKYLYVQFEIFLKTGYYQGYVWDYRLAKSDSLYSRRLIRFLDRQVAIFEKIFEKYSDTKLVRVGVFSNGEAIYKRV